VSEHNPLEQERYPGAGRIAPLPAIGSKDGLNVVPEFLMDDGLAGVPFLLMAQLAEVGPVVEQLVDEALVNGLALAHPGVPGGSGLGGHPIQPHFLRQQDRGAELDEFNPSITVTF
jgi:hypothetical protein